MLEGVVTRARSVSDRAAVVAIVLATVLTVVLVTVAVRDRAAGPVGPSPSLEVSRTRTVVLLGGSYSAGEGASEDARGFAARLARGTGWRVVNLARAGTGYATAVDQDGYRTCGQERCRSFGGMVDRATALSPDADVVMVFGGRADVSSPPEEVSSAVVTFFRRLRDAYPDAEIVAVSPVWDAEDPPVELDTVAEETEREARAVGGTYLDVGQPLRGRPALMDEDGNNPDDDGHQALADAVLARLRSAGLV